MPPEVNVTVSPQPSINVNLNATAAGNYATVSNLYITGQYLSNLITGNTAGVLSVNGIDGVLNILGTGTVYIYPSGQNIIISGEAGAATGNYLTSGEATSLFATIQNLYATGSFLQLQILNTSGSLSNYLLLSNTGLFYTANNPSGFITGLNTGILASKLELFQTGQNLQNQISSIQNGTGLFITGLDTGEFVTNSDTGVFATKNELYNSGQFLYPRNNPSGFVTNSDLSSYATDLDLYNTGQLLYPNNNPSGFITGINTGNFATIQYVSSNYYPLLNISGYVTGLVVRPHETGQFASDVDVNNLSGYLINLIGASSAGVSLLNSLSGIINILGTGLVTVTTNGNNIYVSGQGSTGYLTASEGDLRYYPLLGNPSGFVLTSQTGILASTQELYNSGQFLYPRNNPSGFLTGVNTGNFVTRNDTGILLNRQETGVFIKASEIASIYATIANLYTTGQELYPRNNPSGFITGTLSSLVNAVTGISITGGNSISGKINFYNTGDLIYITQNGNDVYFSGAPTGYLADNGDLLALSGVLVGLISAAAAGVSSINGASGVLTLNGAGNVSVINNGQTITVSGNTGFLSDYYLANNPSGFITSFNVVYKTGDQYISGLKTFETGIAVSGNGIDFLSLTIPAWREGRVFYDLDEHTLSYYNEQSDMELNIGQETVVRVVNQEGSQINNGQVVYLYGAQGQRPSVKLAIATGEIADKVIGIATHNIPDNTNGYVTVRGITRGLNTSAFLDGESLYLSHTGYGQLINYEPPSPNHSVKIGVVAYSHASLGRIYVDPHHSANSLRYMHDVLLNTGTLAHGDILIYDSGSGHWINQPNFSGVLSNNLFLTGQYLYPRNNPSGFITGINTGNFVTTSQTGVFVNSIELYNSGQLLYPRNNPSGFITGFNSGLFVLDSETGIYNQNFYPLSGNPSGYVRSTGGIIYSDSAVNIADGKLLIGSSGHNALILGDIYGQSGISVISGSGLLIVSINQTLFALAADTGEFVTNSDTGILVNKLELYNSGQFLYPRNNPSGFITGLNTGNFVTQSDLLNTSGVLTGLISSSSAGVSTLNSLSGILNITGTGGIFVFTSGQYIYISGGSSTETGSLTGAFYPLNSNPAGYLTGFNSGLYTLNSETGILLNRQETGIFATTQFANSTYATIANLYDTGQNLQIQIDSLTGTHFEIKSVDIPTGIGIFTFSFDSTFGETPKVIGSISNNFGDSIFGYYLSGITSTQFNLITTEEILSTGYVYSYIATTGNSFIGSQGLNFYPNNNPSGFITGVNDYVIVGKSSLNNIPLTGITIDASLGNLFRITMSGDIKINDPINIIDTQRITYEFTQDSIGNRSITGFGSTFGFGSDITGITLSTGINKKDFMVTIYNSSVNKNYVIGFVKGY